MSYVVKIKAKSCQADFEYDITSDKVEPEASSEFLKKIEENCVDFPDPTSKLNIKNLGSR